MAARRGVVFRLFSRSEVTDWREAPGRGRRRQSKKQLVESEGRLAYERLVQTLEARRKPGTAFSLLLTGAAHGVGTSTVVGNLASFLSSRQERRVLIADANLRSPGLYEADEYSASNGLTRVLEGEQQLDEALQEPRGREPWLLPCGPAVQKPSAVLVDDAISALMQQIRSRFDFAIIDGPPVTGYTDVAILAPHVDAVVLVVGAERTRWETAQEAARILEETGCEFLGAILNRRRFYIPESIYRKL